MNLHMSSDTADVPGDRKRSVEEFWPDHETVVVAGKKQDRLVMALGTKELRRSDYANAAVDYQWLYFNPEGARRFGHLLLQYADLMDPETED